MVSPLRDVASDDSGWPPAKPRDARDGDRSLLVHNVLHRLDQHVGRISEHCPQRGPFAKPRVRQLHHLVHAKANNGAAAVKKAQRRCNIRIARPPNEVGQMVRIEIESDHLTTPAHETPRMRKLAAPPTQVRNNLME